MEKACRQIISDAVVKSHFYICLLYTSTLNMYCDRILSIFPNGKLTLADLKTFGKDDKLAKIIEGVSKKVPMRSAMASLLV